MTKESLAAVVRHKALYALLIVALAGVALWSFWPRGIAVETAQARRAPLESGFTEEGRTRLRARYQVNAPLDGVMERVRVEPGDTVSSGAIVAVLRPSRAAMFDPANRAQQESRLLAAKSELLAARASEASARAEYARARAALKRGTALAKEQLIAQEQLDVLRTQDAAAAASLGAAQSRTQTIAVLRDGYQAALDLQGASPEHGISLPLRSPIDGRIIHRLVESETPVRMGQALLEIGDPDTLEVLAEVLTADAVSLKVGNPVRLLRWGGPAPLRGRIRVVEPGGFTKVSALGVEEQRTAVVIDLLDPPSLRAGLGDGYRVDAQFVVWRHPDALQIPVAALFRNGQDWAVYAVADGRARMRRVRIGHIGDDAAEVLSGLSPGARVILYPGDDIRDGSRVRSSER